MEFRTTYKPDWTIVESYRIKVFYKGRVYTLVGNLDNNHWLRSWSVYHDGVFLRNVSDHVTYMDVIAMIASGEIYAL